MKVCGVVCEFVVVVVFLCCVCCFCVLLRAGVFFKNIPYLCSITTQYS
jgi:hypothetical protein